MVFGLFGLRSEALAQPEDGIGAPSDRLGVLDEADPGGVHDEAGREGHDGGAFRTHDVGRVT